MHTPYMPILSNTRQHFEPESSRQVTSAGVIDLAANGMAAALKAYTLPKNFTTQNVFVYCSPQITIQSNLTGAQVIIEQDGKTVASGVVEDGKVTFTGLAPGNYAMRTIYNNQEVLNALMVNHTIMAPDDIKISFNTDLTVESTFLNVNGAPLANTNVTVILDGKAYTMTTDRNGSLNPVLEELSVGTHKLVFNFIVQEFSGFFKPGMNCTFSGLYFFLCGWGW